MTKQDAWNPARYGKFAAERARPFDDLLALLGPAPGGRRIEHVVDLGCGTGEQTARLHEHLGAADTVGIDSSAAMLEKARPLEQAGLHFKLGDIAAFHARGQYDV